MQHSIIVCKNESIYSNPERDEDFLFEIIEYNVLV